MGCHAPQTGVSECTIILLCFSNLKGCKILLCPSLIWSAFPNYSYRIRLIAPDDSFCCFYSFSQCFHAFHYQCQLLFSSCNRGLYIRMLRQCILNTGLVFLEIRSVPYSVLFWSNNRHPMCDSDRVIREVIPLLLEMIIECDSHIRFAIIVGRSWAMNKNILRPVVLPVSLRQSIFYLNPIFCFHDSIFFKYSSTSDSSLSFFSRMQI